MQLLYRYVFASIISYTNQKFIEKIIRTLHWLRFLSYVQKRNKDYALLYQC